MNETKNPPSPTPDQAAAHEFLCELRTRITTQPLPYRYGVEARALESLWEVFGHAREAMKRHPGCRRFAESVTRTLNLDVRPVTARWHRAHAEGRLNSRDGADAFRADLAKLQTKLRRFAAQLHEMAYGERFEDLLTPPALTPAEVENLLADLPFGIAGGPLIANQTATDINDNEADAVARRRDLYGIDTAAGMNGVGLALSGGGIRSATFCLGVVQVLASRGLLKGVDFLSTVSGGGYTGSFLTTRLGTAQAAGADVEQRHRALGNPYGPDPDAIRYLRQHAKYLAANDLKQGWSMVTATLAGMLLNWSAPFLVIVLAALVAIEYRDRLPPLPWSTVVTVSGVLTGVALVAYCGLLRGGRRSALKGGSVLAALAGVTVLLSAGWLLDAGYDLATGPARWWRASALAGSAIAAGPAILRFMPVAKKPVVRKVVLKALLLLAGFIIPMGAIALFYGLWYLGAHSATAILVLKGVAAGLAFIAILLLNINLTGLHRLYRDQLARTFVQADEANDATVNLAEINPGFSAPYQLINTTLNVPSSTNVRLRERRSDFFLFSKHWCGSPSTGYSPTPEWRTNNAAPDLATAMAISGAAASSHMGLGSHPTLRALLAFLNIRLGFWILRAGRMTILKTPGFLCLLREMTGIAMSEQHAWLNLSDGGHIENMGVYELLRRRCKYVICVDGESDPECSFHGLMTLVRHAQIDFGVRIVARLNDVRPDAVTGYSQTHAVLCRVRYPTEEQGLLLYLKLSVTGNEPELIRRYRLLHPEFPHQTTLDQFFDEEQFEAYRQLGVHVADGLFASALMGGERMPGTVPQWFRKLVINLLDPAFA
jgi:hypothetical protein